MPNGIRTTNLERQFSIDELIGNVTDEGVEKTARIPMTSIASVLAGTGAFVFGNMVYVATEAQLLAITPSTETSGGVVLNDTDPTKNGYYSRVAAAWVRQRGFPDTFAQITLGGTANAQTGTVAAGVNPADVLIYFATVSTDNTGPMTLSISGETARDVVNAAGNALSAGEWTDTVLFFLNGDGDYQLLFDAGAAASAAQSATDAETAQAAAELARDQAQAAASSVSPTEFPDIATAEALAPASAPDFIRTAGYAYAGDGGAALYKKVVSEPSHAGKFSITLDDAVTVVWYELAELEPHPEVFGASGDGTGDDTSAIAQWIAYAQAKGQGALHMRPGAIYLADSFDIPDDMLALGWGATVKRRINRSFPLVLVGKRSTVSGLTADGNMTGLGSLGGGTRMTGIALDDDATAIDCRSIDNARHGISNRNVADQLQYYRCKVIRCYVDGNGADPDPSGSGKGDGINMTNVTDFLVRDCVSRNSGRSDMVVTTYDPVADDTDPTLSLGGIIDNIDVDGAAYIGAEVNFEKCSNVKLINSRVLTAGVIFNYTDDVLVQNVQCLSIYCDGGHRPRLFNVDILNPTRSSALLTLINGDDPWVDFVRVVSTMAGTPTGNTVTITPGNFKGRVHNVSVVRTNNAFVMYVDNFSNLTASDVFNRFLREGPTGASYDYLATDNPKKSNGLAEAYLSAAPATGTWLRGDRVWDKTPDATVTPGWICTVAGNPGTWKAMAALAA
jgi:hypothetical protein